MSSTNKHTPNRLLELDALRGFASLAVVLFHFTKLPHSGPSFVYGVTGVELFFMISGFVIFMSINNIADGKEFIVNRVARLYPTYWACVTLTFALQIFTYIVYFQERVGLSKIKQFLINLTMFQYYFKVDNIDGAYWTLIIEMVFYIFIYLLFTTKTLKYIESTGLGILIFLFAIQNIHIDLLGTINGFIGEYLPLFNFYALFLAGVVFYKMYTGKETLYRYFLLAICFVFEALQFKNRGFMEYGITSFQYIIILVIYFGVFFLFVKNKLGFIVSRPTVYLGTISYALYLVHQFMSTSFLIPLLNHKLHLNYWVSLLITLPIVLGIASIITFYIEVPLRSKLRKTLRSWLGIARPPVTPH